MLKNFYRRASGIYVVRIAVPNRLRSLIGRTEIHASTGQVETNAAKLAGLEILLAWRKRFMELDRSKLTIGSPLLLTSGYIALREASEVTGIPLPSLLGEMLSFQVPLYVNMSSWSGIWVPDLYEIERDDDEVFIWNSVEKLGEQRILSGVMARVHNSNLTLNSLIIEEMASIHILRLINSAAFFLNIPETLTVNHFFAEKTSVSTIRSRLAALLPSPPLVPSPISVPSLTAPSVLYDPITAKHGSKKFSDLFDFYKSDRSWGLEQTRRMNTEANLFSELMDNPELGTIERETILNYAAKLATVPSNIYQSKRKFKITALKELIQIAATQGLEVKNESTIKRHIGHLSEILNYGAKNHMLRFNPAADFKRGTKKKVTSAQTDRDTFTPEELERIFSVDWFITGTGKFEARGWTDWRPFNYWLPLIGLFTGARINELSQLYLDDIVCLKSGIWFFDFNLTQPDKVNVDEKDKSLKTMNAIRIIPMHSMLVKLGLPNYVSALRAAGHNRLFPELKCDSVKGYGKPAGSWFNERFLGKKLRMERTGKKVFHSLRHNFITALERLDASESVRAQLAGHQRGKTESGSRYSKDRNAEELKPLIDKLHSPCTNAIAPFDIADGLSAIKVAHRLKLSNVRRKGAASY